MSDDSTLSLDDLPQPTREDVVHPDDLSVDGDNPNEQPDEMFGLLCDNIRKRGWIGNAIVADTDGVIADGEHRWRAAQEIGLDEVPVKFYDIDDAERRLWRQELNKISGEHDTKRDALEYDYLLDAGKADGVQALTKATGEDLDDLLEQIKVRKDKRPIYEYDPDHNIYFEDCVEGMRERLDDDSVDVVFTSPPYNVEKTASEGREADTIDYDDNKSIEEFREFINTVISELERVVSEHGHIFINLDPVYNEGYIESHEWLRDAFDRPLKSKIIWNKRQGHRPYLPEKGQFQRDYEPIYHFSYSTAPLNDLGEGSVWDITAAVEGPDVHGEHPAPFPVELPERAIQAVATEGDTVLDPFMGSGTTAVAAIQNDCDYIGFEIDEDGAYQPIVEKRIGEAKRQMQSSTNVDPDETEEAATDGGETP